MNIERLETGAVTVLRMSGDIDESGVNDLRLRLMECIQERRVQVVANLSDVKYVSYLGVGILLERLRQMQAAGGDLKLVGVNLYTERLMRMVGVTKHFQVFDAEPGAVQSYREAA